MNLSFLLKLLWDDLNIMVFFIFLKSETITLTSFPLSLDLWCQWMEHNVLNIGSRVPWPRACLPHQPPGCSHPHICIFKPFWSLFSHRHSSLCTKASHFSFFVLSLKAPVGLLEHLDGTARVLKESLRLASIHCSLCNGRKSVFSFSSNALIWTH